MIKIEPSGVKELDKIISELKYKKYNLEKSINELENAKEFIYKINDICPRCNGVGKLKYRACAEADIEDYTCRRCDGNGKYKKE